MTREESAHVATPGAVHDLTRGGEGSSMLTIVTAILRGRRTLVRFAALSVVAAGLFTVLQPRSYTATVSFTPTASVSVGSELAGLAAQFGFAIPSLGSGQVPEFYGDLVVSPRILNSVADRRYTFRIATGIWPFDDTVTVSEDLIEVYDIRGRGYAASRERAVENLTNDITVDVGRETGLVAVHVTARWPQLAPQIAERILSLVNQFNLESQQTQARAERRFVEGRLEQLRQELRAAEDRVQSFLLNNRTYNTSPQLVFEHDRLQREVDLLQAVVTSVAQAYEQARIAEVRDTPVITIVEQPRVPARPNRRRLLLKSLLAGLFGLAVAAAWAVGREGVMREGTSAEITEFSLVKEDLRGDLRALAQRIARLPQRKRGRAQG